MMAQINKSCPGRLSKYIEDLWLNPKNSDVTFCIENEKLHAHRLILASRDYFDRLLYGPFAESSQKEIKIEGRVAPFKALLKFIYFGECVMPNELTMDEMLELMSLAQMYDISDLFDLIEIYLKKNISMDTVGCVLKLSQELRLDSLIEISLKFLDEKASDFLRHESFTALSPVSCRYKIIRKIIVIF